MNNSISKLRQKLDSKKIIRIGGAFDAMSAKLVEINDFDAIWAGSFAISATHALPDASILTMTEFLAVAANMAEACDIPIIADCDTGFGGPSNVSHLVKKYESAGIAAISIEDKVFPKQNSLLSNGSHKLLDEKDFVAKIIAGSQAKQNDDFMIIARVESLIADAGMEDALKRAHAYERAGADAILIHSKKSTPDEIFEFANAWSGKIPLISIPTTYTGVTIDQLIQHNFKMVVYANQTLRASYTAMSASLKQMRRIQSLDEIDFKCASMEDIFSLQQMYNIKKQEKEIEANLKKMGYVNE